MKLGATDFVSKPFAEIELETPLAHALEQYRLTKEVAALRDQLHAQSTFSMLFDGSPRMTEVQQLIERLADTDVPVLICGESGTGKELVARALHASSLRRDKPLVKVNCSALPQDLLECELFGFERGAFAGAMQDKPGKFEFANQATMFLDEISAMGLPLQGRLLRVMQEGQFARPGAPRVRVDVRLVAATNRNLEQAVAAGQFREDLHARLNLARIDLPPLRDRRDEVPVLARHFVKKYSVQYNMPVTELSPETMQVFVEYDWPGNVRELETFVKRAIVPGGEVSIRKEIAQNMAMPSPRPAARPAPRTPAEPAAGRDCFDARVDRGSRRRGRELFAEGHLAHGRARGGARADCQDAPAHALEPQGDGGDSRDQLQGAALQDQGKRPGQGLIIASTLMPSGSFYEEGSKLLTSGAFQFVLDSELKRAVRSQSYLTLITIEASREWEGMTITADDGTLQEVAQIIGNEVRDTDLLGHTDKGTLASCCSTPTSSIRSA
jgi:Response regulator containing CheY-like receiver, AAA-type ATPase, and DNA-binding domains